MVEIAAAPHKTALITGVRGQDGSYLAEYLQAQGYRVVGTTHGPAVPGPEGAGHPALEVVSLDLASMRQVEDLVRTLQPDEIYNLAARASSAQLFDDPLATAEINALAAVRFLEAIRRHAPRARFCQAASSEVFAGAVATPQDEDTPLRPVNAYGAAKAYALNMVNAYRLRDGLHASTAILFNHESPRRSEEMVTRKISRGVAMIKAGLAEELVLGDLENRRDWGFAGDYVRAMWLMLQRDAGDDYVIATGETHSVREFCELAFAHVGLDYRDHVRVEERFGRRRETVELRGNPVRARQRLGWAPTLSFAELVRKMVDADCRRLAKA